MANASGSHMTPEPEYLWRQRAGLWARFRWLAPWTPSGCLIFLLLGSGGVCLFVFRQVSPPDWVELKIGPLPKGIDGLFVLADGSGHVESLPPYVWKLLASPLEANRPEGILPYSKGDDHPRLDVQWKRGERYGVLVRFGDGRDSLLWLQPEDIDQPPLRWLFGSSRAEIRIPPLDRAENPTIELLHHLGLDLKFKTP